MDPNETLRLLHEAMESVDASELGFPAWEDVKEHMHTLEVWLAGGGFAPDWAPNAVPKTIVARDAEEEVIPGEVDEETKESEDGVPT